MRRLVVYGAGELGGRVARLWRTSGADVLAATRTETRHAALRGAGIETALGDPTSHLSADDVLLLSLSGTAAQAEGVERLAAGVRPHRAVLVSSTGFHSGAIGRVDEETAVGEGSRARAIAACESAFFEWAGAAGVVVRCGGLYSAGRGPTHAIRRRLRDTPRLLVEGPPDRTLALVHDDDAAAALCAALRAHAPERTYLCVTPPCPSRAEFYSAVCVDAGAPPPEFDAASPVDESSGARTITYDVSRLRRDLVPRPQHPDWREAVRV